jgi:hypothetical protein
MAKRGARRPGQEVVQLKKTILDLQHQVARPLYVWRSFKSSHHLTRPKCVQLTIPVQDGDDQIMYLDIPACRQQEKRKSY